MTSPYDLVTVAQVDAWLGVTTDDATMGPLITQMSRVIMNYLYRPNILPQAYVETFDGDDHDEVVLRNWPVISVTSLMVEGTAVAASPALVAGQSWQTGYVLSTASSNAPPGHPQELILRGKRFYRGRQNCIVSYRAGYQIGAESMVVPLSPGPYTATAVQSYGNWASDAGVVYANGIALTAVAGAPAIGQYSVAAGVYTFNSGDAGQILSVSYGYIPTDIANATLEWIADRYAYRGRVGHQSKSLGGQETVAFIVKAIPDFVAAALQPYRDVVPR